MGDTAVADDSPWIDLAHAPAFALGGAQVRPAYREVAVGAARVTLQPRVMQVLVCLARAGNEPVSRDDLVGSCWGGVAVSEDAINRCIQRLRRLSEEEAAGCFAIETISRVGYRLHAHPGEPDAEADAARRRSFWASGRGALGWPRAVMAGAAVLALTLALAGWAAMRWLDQPTRLAIPLVEVRALGAIGDDPALRGVAARATDAIAAFLGESEVRVVSPSSPIRPPETELAFGGAVSSADGQLRLHLVLNDLRSGTELWSGDYAQPAARADALIDEAKGGAMETINIIRPGYGRNGLMLDPETNLLGLRSGLETVMPTAASGKDAIHDIEQALGRDPNSGLVRSAYAVDLAAAGQQAAPSDQADLFKRAKAEAERTLREHPDQPGTSHVALLIVANTEAPRDWVGNLARVDAALKAAPEEPYLYGFACGAMRGVGRAVDGLRYCQRALALLPHTPTLIVNYAIALDAVGDHATADALLDEGARLYPHFDPIRFYRFDREAWSGSPDKTLALLRDPASAPPLPAAYIAAVESLEKARKSGLAGDADAAMAAMRDATQHDPVTPWRVLFPMALGRLDDAFGAPDLAWFEADPGGSLMVSFFDRFRRDPRFWPVAARAGLVRYWVTTNKWPDFCSDPAYPLDCRAQARRVAALPPTAT